MYDNNFLGLLLCKNRTFFSLKPWNFRLDTIIFAPLFIASLMYLLPLTLFPLINWKLINERPLMK